MNPHATHNPIHFVASAHVAFGLCAVLATVNVVLAAASALMGGPTCQTMAFATLGVLLMLAAGLAYVRALPLDDADIVAVGASVVGGIAPLFSLSFGGGPVNHSVIMLAIMSAAVGTSRFKRALLAIGILLGGWVFVMMPRLTWQDFFVWLTVLLGAAAMGLVINIARRDSINTIHASLGADAMNSYRDELTAMHNRRGLIEMGRPLVELARRNGEAVACTFIDVEGLKLVNDHLGHQEGDRLLQCVAEAVMATTRSSDVACRWGGDEFVVLSLGTGISADVMEARVREFLSVNAPQLPPTMPQVSITAGRALLEPWSDGDLDTVIKQADHDMYTRRIIRRRSAKRGMA